MHQGGFRGLTVTATLLVLLTPGPSLEAQIQAVNPQIRAAKGQNVSPIFEGWFKAPDGSTWVSFGYYNRNTEEVVSVPVGPANRVEPGPADQGQPTRFLPGRQHGVFTARVPQDRPKTEVTWTLTVYGQALSIPGNLDPNFYIEPFKELGGSYPGNAPPTLRLEPAAVAVQGPTGTTITRSTTVAKPLALDVWVADDGLPPPLPPARGRGRGGAGTDGGRGRGAEGPRLSVTWTQFRGTGSATFAQATPPLEQGKASTSVTFSDPGEYMLRVLASDGSGFSAQCCWTNGYVKVVVGR